MTVDSITCLELDFKWRSELEQGRKLKEKTNLSSNRIECGEFGDYKSEDELLADFNLCSIGE